MHPDGYIEIARSRQRRDHQRRREHLDDASRESDHASTPPCSRVAVVAKPDEKWGEVPKAFVTLKAGRASSRKPDRAFAREQLPRFKVPKAIGVSDLPKTSTGKIQKYVLREREWAGKSKRVN